MDGRSACILLVDDDEMVLDVGVLMLERMGYQVLRARTGSEAVDMFRANKDGIDLVLLDLKLPDESGADTFKKIRKISPEARVILSTGNNETQEVSELIDLGCRGMIQKPFGLKDLAQKIGLVLG